MNSDWTSVVLAGGKGTRMNSTTPKPLVLLGGKPLIQPILEKSIQLTPETIVIYSEFTKDLLPTFSHLPLTFVEADPKGTGYAAQEAVKHVKTKNVLITQADDSYFYSLATLQNCITAHETSGSDATLGIYHTTQPNSYTRVEHDGTTFIALHQEPEKEGAKEVVCGMYAAKTDWMRQALEILEPNESGELPLPWVFTLPLPKVAHIFLVPDGEWQGVNTPLELEAAATLL